jgi:hypothetical protein
LYVLSKNALSRVRDSWYSIREKTGPKAGKIAGNHGMLTIPPRGDERVQDRRKGY